MEAKEIRILTGLSQQKFCEMYGIPLRTFEKWEQGASRAPIYYLTALERIVKEDFNIKNQDPVD